MKATWSKVMEKLGTFFTYLARNIQRRSNTIWVHDREICTSWFLIPPSYKFRTVCKPLPKKNPVIKMQRFQADNRKLCFLVKCKYFAITKVDKKNLKLFQSWFPPSIASKKVNEPATALGLTLAGNEKWAIVIGGCLSCHTFQERRRKSRFLTMIHCYY